MKLEDLVIAIAEDLKEYTPAQRTAEALHRWMGREPEPAVPEYIGHCGSCPFDANLDVARNEHAGDPDYIKDAVIQLFECTRTCSRLRSSKRFSTKESNTRKEEMVSLKAQVAALSSTLGTYTRNLEHWRQEVGKLHGQLNARNDEITKLREVTDEKADRVRMAYYGSHQFVKAGKWEQMTDAGRESWRGVVRAALEEPEPESFDEF